MSRKSSKQPPIIVSACLAGEACRYDGGARPNKEVIALVKSGRAIAVCPEVLAGLPTPRTPAEIMTTADGSRRAVCRDGTDLTELFRTGAKKAAAIAKTHGCTEAILMGRSPSCGHGSPDLDSAGGIYSGDFDGKLVEGSGFFAQELLKMGIKIATRR